MRGAAARKRRKSTDYAGWFLSSLARADQHARHHLGLPASTGLGVTSMDEFIAKANIEHVEKLLASETDAHKRRVLENLLAEEKSKVAAALKRRDEREER